MGEADVARGGTQGWFPLKDGAVLPWRLMLVPAGRWSSTTVAVHHGVIREHDKVHVPFELGLVDKNKLDALCYGATHGINACRPVP